MFNKVHGKDAKKTSIGNGRNRNVPYLIQTSEIPLIFK